MVNVSRRHRAPVVPVGLEHPPVTRRDILAVSVPGGLDKPNRANGPVYVHIDEVHEATRDLADLVNKGPLESAGGRGWRTAHRQQEPSA